MNLGDLRSRVRRLTDIYSNDLIDNALINAFINEAYDEIATSRIWPWLNGRVPLVNDADTPVFDEIFHPALSYRAAQKVLTHQSDTTARGETYSAEYGLIVQRMVELYMPAIATGGTTTLEELRWLVRDLVGAYTFEVPDRVLNRLINDSYNDLARLRQWQWLEATYVEELAVDATTLTLPNGARRVLNVFVDDDRNVVEADSRPVLNDIPTTSQQVFYDVTYSGVLTLAPAQKRPVTVTVRYLVRNVELTETTGTAFDNQFNSLLAYMAALKVIGIYGSTRAVPEALASQVQEGIAGMISEYMVDHTDETMQMGGDGTFYQRNPSYLRFI
jgi:hypothetical protein